ncbi:MAG: hypothetical protein PHW10_03425 [Candidatus Peribacteraceae bacterium]|nr:hypothetical protein [Candidatus Peribacteraceae bacterium]
MLHPFLFGGGPGFFLLGGLHVLSAIAGTVGAILLLMWAFKHLSEKQLWKWGWLLVVAGIFLCVLTYLALFYGVRWQGGGVGWMMGGGRFGPPVMQWNGTGTFVPQLQIMRGWRNER